MPAQLYQKYRSTYVPEIMKDLSIKNVHAVPKLVKVVISIGLGESILTPSAMESAVEDVKVITGQAPMITKAKKSISNFKLREGMKIGLKATLRGAKMYAFVERLVNVALPRVRDFRGIPSTGFDGTGNYNLGLREQYVFPEIDYDKIDKARGMQITFVTSGRNDEEARLLLTKFGLPFKKN